MIVVNRIIWLVLAPASLCGLDAYGEALEDDTLEVFTTFDARVQRTYALRYDGKEDIARDLITKHGMKFVGRVSILK